ncbi:hypothetical protein FJ366_03950 [Candidatus Dependentiae bacterium]|nr:hypothetical protein [Candidatus Dependentiae bacterium]
MKKVTYVFIISLAFASQNTQAVGYESAQYLKDKSIEVTTYILKTLYNRWFAAKIDAATQTDESDNLSLEKKEDALMQHVIHLSLKPEEDEMARQAEILATLIAETQQLVDARQSQSVEAA